MQPNVMRRRLHSDILGMSFRLWISMKARKCIMKAGSLDNYLLNTKPKVLDSKMALLLRDMVLTKKKNPDYVPEYLPGQANVKRTRKTKVWDYKNVPAMYMTVQQKLEEDQSKYYIKTPQEMSRYEIAELEKTLKQMEEPLDFGEKLEDILKDPEIIELQRQMKQLLPIRNSIIKRYFDKFKF